MILRIENHKYLRFATGFLTLGGNLLRVNCFFICVCDTQTQMRCGRSSKIPQLFYSSCSLDYKMAYPHAWCDRVKLQVTFTNGLQNSMTIILSLSPSCIGTILWYLVHITRWQTHKNKQNPDVCFHNFS